ncbi:hypothetical protein ACEN3H_12780 [Acinetobacter lactucae]|uniref:hypothetical protein n=1 Tax=Acinetobacter lactucae TaxID=1785128 RepID=UPI00358DC6A4
MNNDLLFVLSNSSESFLFLTFRAKNLTHSERTDIILEAERMIGADTKKRIYLVWDTGHAKSDLTVYAGSEPNKEQIIAFSDIKNFFHSYEIQEYPLPTYLKKQRNISVNFTVFPSKDYIQRFFNANYD